MLSLVCGLLGDVSGPLRPEMVHIIMAMLQWLYENFCPGAGSDGAARAWADVLSFRVFAGELWRNPDHPGMAANWAISVDNLIDLLDIYNIRGDH